MDREQQEAAERFWRKVEEKELAKFREILGAAAFRKFEGRSYHEVMAHIRECHMKLLRKERQVDE